MKTPLLFIFALLFFTNISCKREIDYSNVQQEDISREDFDLGSMDIYSNDDVEIYHDITGDYPNGIYCAEVEYNNPNTGTRNTYDLDIDVEDGDLTVIHWPNGGWLDDTHFRPESISSGEVSFRSDKGYRYTVILGDFGGCGYTDDYKIRIDVNKDVEATTCPQCGEDKTSYEEICDDCKSKKEEEQDKIDHTCSVCGGEKFSSFDEVCDDCKRENEDY